MDLFSNYAWVAPLKDKRSVTIVNVFQKVVDKSDHKSNKIRVEKVSEFLKMFF